MSADRYTLRSVRVFWNSRRQPRIGFDFTRARVNSPGMANESFSFEEAIGLTQKPQPSGAADPGGFSFEEALGKPAQASPGFIPTIKRTGGQMLTTAATAAEDVVGPNVFTRAVHDAGQGIIDRNPAGIRSLRDLVDSPWLAVKESVGQFAPQIAAAAAGGAAGARMGGAVAGPTGAAVGGAIGGLVPIFTQEYGGIRQEQKESGQEDKARALAAAIPATALERVGMGKALNVLKGVPGGAAGTVLKEVGKGVLKEGATEGAQNVIEQWGAFKDPTKAENLEDTALSAAMGGIGGGVMGAGAGAMDGARRRAQERAEVQVRQSAEAAAADAQAKADAIREEQRAAAGQVATDAAAVRSGVLADEEGVQPEVPQTTPPDGRAVLESRRAADRAQASPDDEIYQSTGADVRTAPPVAAEPLQQAAEPVESDPRTPSQRMGINPDAGPLSRNVATAIDSAAVQDAQFLGATDRDLQVRSTGPGVADESNVIDVEGRVVEDRALGMPRRLTTDTPEGLPVAAGVAEPINRTGQPLQLNMAHALRAQADQAGMQAAVVRHASGRGYDVVPRLPASAVVAAPGGAPFSTPAAAQAELQRQQLGATHELAPAGGDSSLGFVLQKKGTSADSAPAAQAQTAINSGVNRAINWRSNALQANRVARDQGIDPKGKRLAQVVAEIDAADALRAGVRQDGADLSAGQIDREWSAFAPETGTLGVPRAEMPQIKAEHRGALVNFLKARGIDSRAGEVPANDLKPTQAEFSPAKVAKARGFQGGDRSILVSSDGYVVDGHHQWLAKRANGEPVKVIRLQAPIRQVLAQTAAFPSTAASRGAAVISSTSLADLHAANGPYPPSAATRADDGRWQPAVKTGPGGGRPIGGAPTFSDAGSAAAWAGYEQAKARNGADVAALQHLQDGISSGVRTGEQDGRAAPRSTTSANAPEKIAIGADGESAEGEFNPAVQDGLQQDIPPAPRPRQESAANSDETTAVQAQEAINSGVDSPNSGPRRARAAAPRSTTRIEDFGEKIGGARKDQDAGGGGRATRPRSTDDRPAWARRFEVSQIAKSSAPGEMGRWTVRDTRSTDSLGQPRRVGERSYATQEDAEQAVPLIAVGQKHRVVGLRRGDGTGWEIWRDVTDRKRVKVVDQVFATREAALEHMAKNAQQIIETNTTFGEADLPRPDSDQRVGAVRRDGDARDSDFTRVFGFRGVEFGNWNNQEERQQLLNDAYDGLLDLAEVMRIPPRAVSLNGELALAFGARGHGLSGARAHYEPGKAVINLTKMNGAGSLAHEWFHALDHYFARQDGKASAQWAVAKDGTRSLQVSSDSGDNMVSSGTRGERSGMRAELRDAFAELMRTMSRKAEQYLEDTAKADQFVASARADVQQRLEGIRADLARQLDERYVKRNNKPATAEQLAAFDAVAEKIVAGELLDLRVETKGGARSVTSGIRWTNDALNQLSAIMKAVRGRQGFNADQDGPLDRLRSTMQHYSARLKMLADAQASSEKTRMVPTRFAMDAKELDQGRGKDYWTTPHEMAARAFQGYVEDKIAEQGGKSPFLNHGPESAAIATPWGWKRPFPVGQERRAINAALDKLVGTIRTKEDGESVVLYNTSSEALPERGLSLEQAQQAVEQALAGLASPPPIQVVLRAADLGQGVPDYVKGVRKPDGQLAVVARAHSSPLDVIETVFHELFHQGLRNIVSDRDYVQAMLDLAKRDARVHQYALQWKKEAPEAAEQREALRRLGYAGAELNARYEALAIEEGLAVVAEELRAQKQAGTKLGMRVRVLANWLASVAERMGMQGLADSIRKMTYNDAERFVLRAIENAGRAPLEQGGAATDSMTRFRSREGTPPAQRVGDVLQHLSVTNLRQQAGFKAADYRGLALQFLGRRQLVDVYGDMLPEMGRYSDLMARMDADKNEAGAGADQLAQDWAKLPDERALAELMHDSTLAQIDPTKNFVDGDNKTDWTRLRARHQALSPAAREVYARARDTYRQHMHDVRSAIKERIERAEMSSERRAALLKRMDDEFFGHIKGVYFPLARFGQYVVVVKGADGKVENVSRAETMAEADTTRRQLLAAFPPGKGFTVGKVLKAKDFVAERDTVGRGFMEQLYGVLDKQGMDAKQRAELEDALGQLYLSSLPDLSWAKHGIHRKGTAGFSQDARRAFAQNVFHGASYLAKLRYGDQLQDELGEMQRRVDGRATDPAFDSVKAQQVVDEMVKRHDAAMNPKTNALSTALTSFGFMFHLGLSPASAMVNLTQTALVAYPVMGARWGFSKAGAALLQASQEAVRGKNDITASLTADEKAAFDEAVRSGVIDVTMAHDLAGIAQGEDRNVSHKLQPVMKAASFLFHHAEKFNRQVTFVAAYRLARETGADAKTAYAQAAQATYDGHFDYSANNRPRVMQGNVARVLLLFKQYGQNMVYTLARSAQQSLKGATPEARAQARKALAGLLTTHAMAAGVLGLPMVTTLLAAASMLGGDDDEPWDAKVALQNLLADTFGQKPAEVLAHGLSRLTPWDISGRVGLDKLIFPDVQEGLEGQRLGESAMTAALGPVAAIGINALKGLQEMSEGRYQRGLETMAPSVARGPLKAIRYGSEGVKDKSGIVVQDEVDAAALWGQAAGFSPSSVRNSFEGKSAIVGHDRALQARRSALVEQFAMAAMAKDEEGKAEARESIAKFNEKNPNRRILPMQLAQSVAMRQKRIREAQEGVYLPSKRRDAMETGRFAAPD